ncbi:MAG: hypothetical protein L6R48_07750, partial [Planctomycetes bacterium]|nr:hypothetical protein [Planctomycetota bacterium]
PPPAFAAVDGVVIAIAWGADGQALLASAPAQPIVRAIGRQRREPSGPADCSGTLRLAADASRLWARFTIRDDKLVAGVNRDHQDDSCELYLSPLLHGGTKYLSSDVQIVATPADAGCSAVLLSGRNYDPELLPVSAQARRTADGWELDLGIPLANGLFRLRPGAGLALGVAAAYNDNDSGTQRDQKIGWSLNDPDERAWDDPTRFGVAVFQGPAGVPTLPAVASGRPAPAWDAVPAVTVARPGAIDLLANGGFAHGTAGWNRWYGEDGVDYRVETVAGDPALLLDGGAALAHERAFLCTRAVDVLPGERYRLSFRARADAPLELHLASKTQAYRIVNHARLAVPAGDWVARSCDFTIPADHLATNDAVQATLQCPGIAGHLLWLDDVRLVRWVPGRVDAELVVDDPIRCVAVGGVIGVRARLASLADVALPAVVTLRLESWPDAERVGGWERRVELPAGGTLELPIELPTAVPGCYRVSLAVDDGAGLLHRRTSVAVHVAAGRGDGLGDLTLGHCVYLPEGAAVMADAARRLGARSVRAFLPNAIGTRPGAPRLGAVTALAEALRAQDLLFQGCLATCWHEPDRTRRAVEDPLAWSQRVEPAVRGLRGLVGVWEIGNEPNLREGWRPVPDARAYEAALRAVHGMIRTADPGALVSTAGFNRARPQGFIDEFLAAGAGSFCDQLTFHFYDTVASPTWREDAARLAAAVDRLRPGLRLVDGESGADHEPIVSGLEKLVKRLPVLAWSGVAVHNEFGLDRFCSGWLVAEGAGATPGVPALALQNRLFAGAVCTGWGEPMPGLVVYAFTAPAGPLWVVWREPGAARQAWDLGPAPAARVLDCLGAEVGGRFRRDGRLVIDPPGRLPVYVLGLPEHAGVVWRRPPGRPAPAARGEWPVVVMPQVTGGRGWVEVAGGAPTRVTLTVRNQSPSAVRVLLGGEAPTGLTALIEPMELDLAAGATAAATLVLSAAADCPRGADLPVRVVGSADGRALVPWTLAVRPAALAAEAGGRGIRLRHPGPGRLTGTWTAASEGLVLAGTTQGALDLAPGETAELPCRVTGWRGAPAPAELDLTVQAGGSQRLRLRPAVWSAVAAADGAVPVAAPRLQLPTAGKAVLQAGFAWDGRRLLVDARIEDARHRQGGDGGFIDQGDCLVLELDPRADGGGPAFGADDREVGVALREDGRVVCYRWDGRFGPEAAKPWPEATATVERQGTVTRYRLALPLEVPAGARAIGLGLRLVQADGSGQATTLAFGAPGDGRDPGRWGTLLLPDAPAATSP